MPYTLALKLIAALALLGAVFFAGWHIQGQIKDGQIAALKLEYAQAQAAAVAAAQEQTDSLQKAKDEALKDAQARTLAHAADAEHARTELDRLRVQIANDTALISKAPAATAGDYAATAGALLAECGGALVDMARKAQGHADDSLTCRAAWPTYEKEKKP